MIELIPKYRLLGSDSRYFIITGGRGSSKSFAVSTSVLLQSFEPGHRILFTRQTMTSAHLSIIPEFLEKIQLLKAQRFFHITKSDILNKQSNVEILFRGIKTSSGDQTGNLKSLQGVTTWVLDEAEELVDERKFDDIDLSFRKKGQHNRVILIMNPATKEHWIYKRFFEDMGVEPGFSGVKGYVTYIHTTYLDNIDNLDESYIRQVELMKVNKPLKYQHMIMGGWLDKAEGVIFSNWKIGDYKNVSGIELFGQDYGFSVDPTTLIRVSVDISRKIIYVKEELYKTGLTTSQIYEYNKNIAGVDGLIYADSAEPRLIQELRNLGLNVQEADKGPGSVTAGIAMLLDFTIVVDSESVNMIKELNNYVWHDKKSKTPIDAWNHTIDPLRYVVYTYYGGKKLLIF